MRILFCLFLCSLSLPLVASGFVLPRNQLYTSFDYRFTDVSESFNNRGDRISQPEINLLENGIQSHSINWFLAYGLTDRLSVTTNFQYAESTLDNRFAAEETTSGLSDVWLGAMFRLYYRDAFSVVLNTTTRLPQQDNEPRSPQITNGENAWTVSLGLGYGAETYYVEGDLGYTWNEGFVNNVRENGLPYEDEWFVQLKSGWNLHPKLALEAFLRLRETTADLEGQGFIAGIYTNADETKLRLTARYLVDERWGFGLYGDRTLAGKNVLLGEEYGINAFLRWSFL